MALFALGLVAACTPVPPLPGQLAAQLAEAAHGGWPDVCRVPPPEEPDLFAAEVRAELARTRMLAAYEAGVIRFRAGLRALPPEPPQEAEPAHATPAAAPPSPPPVVEPGVGETVRTETASGSLADLLLWLEGALSASGGQSARLHQARRGDR